MTTYQLVDNYIIHNLFMGSYVHICTGRYYIMIYVHILQDISAVVFMYRLTPGFKDVTACDPRRHCMRAELEGSIVNNRRE